MKLKKGSKAAKDFMSKIRAKKGKVSGWKKGNTQILEVGEKPKIKNVRVKRTKAGTFNNFTAIRGIKNDVLNKSKMIIQKTINGMQKKYMAIYQKKGEIIDIAIFKASSLLEAKKYASAHKRHSPEFKKYKSVSTSVKLYKN